MIPIAVSVTAAAVLWLAARWQRARRGRRRRAETVRRLEVSTEGWYRVARSFECDATGYAFQLRSFGEAALECARELATLDDGSRCVWEWDGPPFKPVALERTDRPGPRELWRRFDHAFENVWKLAHPFDSCVELGEATIALADWIQTNRPLIHPPPKPGENENENAGVEAAFIHAASAPCLATLAAENTVRDEGMLQLDCETLAERVQDNGTAAQRTMLAVAIVLTVSSQQQGGPTIGELLTLEDTDLCHALEAIALARKLRRVYPAQRPELLWMHAALADSDGDG